MPSFSASSRVLDGDFLAVEQDPARLGRRDAEERQADVGPSGADEAGEAEDLALSQVERDALEGPLDAQSSTCRMTSPGFDSVRV